MAHSRSLALAIAVNVLLLGVLIYSVTSQGASNNLQKTFTRVLFLSLRKLISNHGKSRNT